MEDTYVYPALLTICKIVIILWALVAEELGWRGYLQDRLEEILPHKYIPLFTGNMMFNLYRFDPQRHGGNHLYYWIATVFYATNILLFILYEKGYIHCSEEE